ncbi:hypothetical protein FC680_08725 [Bacillus cereus]|nr:hypothetical protein FC680_08725 [Bacillus cereus]
MSENNWKTKIILFLTAQTISLFGSSLVQYAIIWYITLTTSSGVMLTISTVCGFLPQIANSCALPLGMIIFGPLSDIFSVEILLIYAGIFVLFCAMYIVLSKRFEV